MTLYDLLSVVLRSSEVDLVLSTPQGKALSALVEAAYAYATFDEKDDMCPNCVTPSRCNSPHFQGLTECARKRTRLLAAAAELGP